jgi:hypothetical protein
MYRQWLSSARGQLGGLDMALLTQPLLSYPPRGVAQLWEAPADRLDPLADVIGKTRAALVDAQRRGRMVLYQRTAAATALLAANRRDGSAERIG